MDPKKRGYIPYRGGCNGEVVDGKPCNRCGQKNI